MHLDNRYVRTNTKARRRRRFTDSQATVGRPPRPAGEDVRVGCTPTVHLCEKTEKACTWLGGVV